MSKNFTFNYSSDPEIFIQEKSTGKVVSAIEILGHDKHDPIVDGPISFYSDNVAIEFSVLPANNKKELVANLRDPLTRIKNYFKKVHGDKYELIGRSFAELSEDQLQHPDAKLVGCSPNYDAYKMEMNHPADFVGGGRSTAFHLHYGRSDFKSVKDTDGEILLDPFSKVDAIIASDYFVGLPLLLVDKDESSSKRRTLYGKAGEHRPTPYGAEYRVLGSYFMRSPELVELVSDLVELMFNRLKDGTYKSYFDKIDKDSIVKAINENDLDLAREIVSKLDLPAEILSKISKYENFTFGESVFENWNIQ
jgi:Phage phiEco32-like COOH.NH2 ligase-type 2